MAKNPYDGLQMHINVETKEWNGEYFGECDLCQKKMKYYKDDEEGTTPLILTHIEKASLDQYKYFCSYNCFEDWIDKFIINA